jgi:hypothetical protein
MGRTHRMTTLSSSAGTGAYRVDAVALICGPDIALCLYGGTHPHVGACALALPRPSLLDAEKPSASASVLTALGHKEDEVVRAAALDLATAFGSRVSVCAGIHIDDATSEDIALLWANYEQALSEIKEKLRQEIEALS